MEIITQDEALQVAQNFVRVGNAADRSVMRVKFHPDDGEVSFMEHRPAWEIWFEGNHASGVVPYEIVIFVDAKTRKPWNFTM